MRIFVVSDTHGNINDFIHVAKTLERPDLIIHLGDYVEDGLEIEKQMGVEVVVVKGNCDFYAPDFDDEKTITIENKKIFITHGHKYNVKFDTSRIFYKGKEEDADLVLFGHTHYPELEEKDGTIILNPGSASLPRALNRRTFAIVDIGEKITGKIVSIK